MAKPSTTTFTKLANPTIDREFLKQAEAVIDRYIPNWNYSITPQANMTYFIGLSGGVDSSALGLVLLVKHPEIDWHCFFSDTGNEPNDVRDILKTFAYKLGAKVTIGLPEKSLFEKIESNGYLPGPKSRWCTNELKIKVFQEFIADILSVPNSECTNMAGVRYDERDRQGIIGIDRVHSAHPFVDQKVEREAVVKIAAELGVLGSTYFRMKSRSGCLNCLFLSKQELIALAIWDPKQFKQGGSVEKLSEEILTVLDDSHHPVADLGYYTGYPMPALIVDGKASLETTNVFGEDVRMDDAKLNWDYLSANSALKRNCRQPTNQNQLSFLDDCEVEEETGHQEHVDIYVAIEHLLHPLMSSNMGVYSQIPISYSTSKSGLTRTINGYLYHRKTVADGYYQSQSNYELQSHITVMCLRFPRSVLPQVDYSAEGVYTWSHGISYAEIGFTMRAINRLCNWLYCKQVIELSTHKRFDCLTVAQSKKYLHQVEQSGVELGEMIGIGHFKPVEDMNQLRDFSYDEDPRTLKCPICSL